MLNNSIYYDEVFREDIQSAPKGQMEAARSNGLSKGQALVCVIIPQANRNALPEQLRVAREALTLIHSPSPIVLAGLLYTALLWPLVRLLSRLENCNRVMR